ncbi:hypothetical protein CFOL_v3_31825 [Cephalotus follicularis]|uniref:Uncharacterized protein n=1 Tax=Cephalotus follicularis TaxID=3775 RepID=A0A1Q3D7G9_CEPFO|nr:hypothetical protein CFOL_v3_31825 [Cephalotus follicularis]
MDPVGLVVEKVKGIAKSSQDFIGGFLHRNQVAARRNPIEILKRLQREAFSDLMQLRDRQDKVERIISYYNTSNGRPFQEESTHVRGEVDALGAILLTGNIDQQHYDAVGRAGIRTGIDSRVTFESTPWQKDKLIAEFVVNQKSNRIPGDVSGSPLSLSLAKVCYMANVSDWFSAIAIPIGAKCKDIDIITNSSHQEKGLTDSSSFGPPLLNQHNGSAIGLTVKNSNVVASLVQSISGLGMHPTSVANGYCFSTFGQVICQLPRGAKLSLLGLHQRPRSSTLSIRPGALTIPVGFLRNGKAPETTDETFGPPLEATTQDIISTGSIALKLESKLDECTRIGGWIEMKNTNPAHLQWAVNVYDDSEYGIGWGMSLSGMIEGTKGLNQFQSESYLKFNLGKRLSLKPGVAYVTYGNAKTFALMLRSNWSL